jgi:hypothetical protein
VIRDRLVKSNASNTGWQRDLSVAFERLGNVQRAQGDLAGALKFYSESLNIRDQLVKSNASNTGWQRDLSVAWQNTPCSRSLMPFHAQERKHLGLVMAVGLLAARPRHTSRGFLPWRFAYAGPSVRRATFMGPPSANLRRSGHSKIVGTV